MQEYPDNSYLIKEKNKADEKAAIVSAKKRTNKSIIEKMVGFFVPSDVDDVKGSIVTDVIIPGIKIAIADTVSIVLFGEPGRIGGGRSGSSKISYNRFFDTKADRKIDYSRPRSSSVEADDIIFETRGDAELVLERLEEAIEAYGVVSVADLCDLSDVPCKNHTANKYGWTNLRNSKVVKVYDGYILQLPRAQQIND